MNGKLSLIFAASAFVLAALPAWAEIPCANVVGNLVANCSFEAAGGSFNNWTVTDASSGGANVTTGGGLGASSQNPLDGNATAVFSDGIGSDDTISQTLATVAGTKYTISFYAFESGGSPNQILLDFGGTQIASVSNLTNTAWTQYTFTTPAATSSSEVLEFKFGDDPGFLYFDNVVASVAGVASAPEPATWALMSGGVALALAFRRLR